VLSLGGAPSLCVPRSRRGMHWYSRPSRAGDRLTPQRDGDAERTGGGTDENPTRDIGDLPMKMHRFEKHFVNNRRHSDRIAREAETRVRGLGPRPGGRLLDVGCGNGAAAIRLTMVFGLEVIGVDIDPDQIAAARAASGRLDGVRFLVVSAAQLPFPDDEFDFVYTNKTTHHIADWPRAITEMARVLKPSGYLVYADFVVPAGRRFPTRRGVNSVATSQGLARNRHSWSPFQFTAIFHVSEASEQEYQSGP